MQNRIEKLKFVETEKHRRQCGPFLTVRTIFDSADLLFFYTRMVRGGLFLSVGGPPFFTA